MEPLMKILLYMLNWLHAIVASQWTFAVFKGISFDKAQSRRFAKWITFSLPFFIISTSIYESIHRDLFNDGEQNRNLCVILYSPFLQDYSSGLILFHFLTPFSINLFSTIIIIGKAIRRRTLTLTEQHYKQHLRDQ
jgi:hypothetical protein